MTAPATIAAPETRWQNNKANRVAALRHLAAKLESYTREVEGEPFNASMACRKCIDFAELEFIIALQGAFDPPLDCVEINEWRDDLCRELRINPRTGCPIGSDGEDMDGSEASFDNRYFVREWM